MKRMIGFLVIALLVVGVTFSFAQDKPSVFKTKKQVVSYAMGYNMGRQLKAMAQELDIDIVMQGLKDCTLGNKEKIPVAEMQKVLKEFYNEYTKKLQEKKRVQGEKNVAEGEAFLKKNAQKPGVKVTKSGLQYLVIKEGKGPKPKPTDTVTVHYRGTLINGKEFDSSYKRGEPIKFPLNRVIRGWTEGLQLMSAGAKYKLFIPSKLAYGERGAGTDIAPNAVLIFDVELLSFEPPKAKKPPQPKAAAKGKK
jgi:FKBP-type peptidyl-prolyl cis-trans isomerase